MWFSLSLYNCKLLDVRDLGSFLSDVLRSATGLEIAGWGTVILQRVWGGGSQKD